jgi:hypothetical protein
VDASLAQKEDLFALGQGLLGYRPLFQRHLAIIA